MYIHLKYYLCCIFFFVSGSLSAATVDINGKTYLTPTSENGALAAKLGETTTRSYAWDISETFDTEFNATLASGFSSFQVYEPSTYALDVNDNSNSAFSIQYNSAVVNGNHYALMDISFSPTASTMAADYESTNNDPNGGRIFRGSVYTIDNWYGYYIVGQDNAESQARLNGDLADFFIDVFTYNGYLVGWDLANNSDGYELELYGTVLPEATSVSAVPVPGSLAMMGLGLLGFGALKRRKT